MIKTLLAQVKQYKKVSISTPVFTALEAVMEIMIPLVIAAIIDKGIEIGNLHNVYIYGAFMLVLAGLSLIFGIVAARLASAASTGFACNLRDSMYENIQTFSFSNIDKYSTAGLVTRLTTDVTNLQNAYQMTLRICVRAPVMLVSALIMSFAINVRISSVFLIAIVVLSVCLAFIIKFVTKIFDRVFLKYDNLNASAQENISAIRVVKSYVREQHENDKFTKAANDVYRLFLKAEKILTLNSPVMMSVIYGCIIFISWFGAKMIVGGTLTTGELTTLISYVMNILMSLMMISMVFVMLGMSTASAHRIAEIINEKSDIENPMPGETDIADGSIDFNHVYFSYKKGSGQPVLYDIDLHIKSGETIGIIGGTGSAKSSLVNLISRLYDVTEGSVEVGGKDVRRYDIEHLRDGVSVVLQKNVLFSGTILENLRWGNAAATEEQCAEACRLACADEFIQKFPDKYNTIVERGGTNLSGGQKQRLCIARALLKNPKILILDDSTSAVDTATDAKIREALTSVIPGTTKIIIAQRVSSVQNADRIVVMNDGRIDAFDTHENLLERNEIYKDVYYSQTRGGGDFDREGGEQ